MSVISIQNLSKYYRLGVIGGGTLREDVDRWWARVRGKPDPLLKVGMEDHGNRKNGEIWALRDINLEVEEGEILGIIGRNGAGKSTLLKILSRITAPTSGRAVIRGRVGSLLEVGTGFHPELTGRENIFLNGTILGMARPEVSRKLDEIVDFAEMGKFIDTPVKRYSSGMTVRLAFAVAAHLEPEILIVDEVLAVGDAAFQRKCLGKIGEVASEGRTVLFVSHNMGSVARLCTQCAWLSKGTITEVGVPEAVVSRYLSGSSGKQGRVEFPAPDASARNEAWPVSVELVSPGGKVCSTFKTTTPLIVRIGIQVEELLQEIGVSLIIARTDGTVVIHSVSLNASTREEYTKGFWIFECDVPGDFLNFGVYTLSVFADIPYRKILFRKEDALSFEVTPYGDGFRRYPPSTWKGALSPQAVSWKEKHDECQE